MHDSRVNFGREHILFFAQISVQINKVCFCYGIISQRRIFAVAKYPQREIQYHMLAKLTH